MKKPGVLAVFAVLVACFSLSRAAEEKKPVPKEAGGYEVKAVKDIPYVDGKDADPVRHKLDLYLPKGQSNFPVLFFVHGGSWRHGVKELYRPLGVLFASHGIGTVIINYRLSPAVKHPAHIQDVARAFAWTHRNIGKYGGRADQIVISGHSAGGHLVALLATDPRYVKAEKLGLSDIKAVMALSGVYRIPGIQRFDNVFGTDPVARDDASPLNHVTGQHPPFLIVYADKDFPTCDRVSEEMCKALQSHKCSASTLKIDDRNHITIIVRMAIESDPATQAALRFIGEQTRSAAGPAMRSAAR